MYSIIFIIIFLSIFTPHFVISYKRNKRYKKLNQWTKFHEQVIEWSKEIRDDSVRSSYVNECVNNLILVNNDSIIDKYHIIDKWDIDFDKEEIDKKWGQHIPSLRQEIREKKLSKILKC